MTTQTTLTIPPTGRMASVEGTRRSYIKTKPIALLKPIAVQLYFYARADRCTLKYRTQC